MCERVGQLCLHVLFVCVCVCGCVCVCIYVKVRTYGSVCQVYMQVVQAFQAQQADCVGVCSVRECVHMCGQYDTCLCDCYCIISHVCVGVRTYVYMTLRHSSGLSTSACYV